ncbi:hypothetical protein LUW77_30715 [Streptomyces radiopugnans]|nr:hypothetical protein LUW77_30715 [Streptomyces radiopugnans]
MFLPALRPLLSLAWSRVAARTGRSAAERSPVRAAFEERLGDRITRQA